MTPRPMGLVEKLVRRAYSVGYEDGLAEATSQFEHTMANLRVQSAFPERLEERVEYMRKYKKDLTGEPQAHHANLAVETQA